MERSVSATAGSDWKTVKITAVRSRSIANNQLEGKFTSAKVADHPEAS
jgi:hypothetical protein